ncbi:MAG: methyltransferase [Bacteroidetes bacterium]|nr:methyltransferase [Bacteroidota bacterium]
MPNPYFRFKQFTIHQDQCAMKVCTDACLFGAQVAAWIKEMPAKTILDIGTGTGLLSLMLAQQTNAAIDAVELDTAAYAQARENVTQSPFKEKITIIHADINQLDKEKLYDGIIANPPFYEADLRSDDAGKNAAKHDTALTYDQLLAAISDHLVPGGWFAVLLPYHRSNYFEQLALKKNFHCNKKLVVQQTVTHDYFRSILLFSCSNIATAQSSLYIRNGANQYSEEFVSLLKPYYLTL